MAFNFRAMFSAQSTAANKPHFVDFATARSVDQDPVLEIRNGGTALWRIVFNSATTKFRVTVGEWAATAIGVAYGGTNKTATPTNGQLLIGNGTDYTLATVTAGAGIGVTNGAGSLTIANTLVASVLKAHSAANQSLATATLTKIVFGTELWDTEAAFASSTYTAPSDGKRRISGQVFFNASGLGGQRLALVYVNGVEYTRTPINAGSFDCGLHFDVTLDLAENDTIDIYGYQDTGGALNVISGAGRTWVEVTNA